MQYNYEINPSQVLSSLLTQPKIGAEVIESILLIILELTPRCFRNPQYSINFQINRLPANNQTQKLIMFFGENNLGIFAYFKATCCIAGNIIKIVYIRHVINSS